MEILQFNRDIQGTRILGVGGMQLCQEDWMVQHFSNVKRLESFTSIPV